MNGDCNAFGSGKIAPTRRSDVHCAWFWLNVGGGWPGELDKSTSGIPANIPYCVVETRRRAMGAVSRRKGFRSRRFDGFVLAASRRTASPTMSRTTRRLLDSICLGAMSTDRQQQCGFERPLRRDHRPGSMPPRLARQRLDPSRRAHYLAMHAYNLFSELTFNERYGKI